MCVGRSPHPKISIKYNNCHLKQVQEFTYLGSVFNSNCDGTHEVKRRITIAKKTAGSLKNIWKCKGVKLETKKRLMQMMIWSIMSYGSETWIYSKDILRRIQAFETWCYRRILRISWCDFITNDEVYERIGTQPVLVQQLLKRRQRFLGHTIRKDGLTSKLISGRVHGKRPRGRPRKTWLKDVCYHVQLSASQALRLCHDREQWKQVGNPPI